MLCISSFKSWLYYFSFFINAFIRFQIDSNESNNYKEGGTKPTNSAKDIGQDNDETDSSLSHNMSIAEDNEEYVRVAGGKILNRTNCTYRKKMNSTKIDPVSVISTEPEYVSDTAYVDDKIMKENLLNNLMNDIERKGRIILLVRYMYSTTYRPVMGC